MTLERAAYILAMAFLQSDQIEDVDEADLNAAVRVALNPPKTVMVNNTIRS